MKNAADVMAESPIVTGITIRHRIAGTGLPPAIGALAAGLVGEDPVKLDADQWRVVDRLRTDNGKTRGDLEFYTLKRSSTTSPTQRQRPP